MNSPCCLLPLAISEMMADAAVTGHLTVADRYGLMAAILNDSLDEEERAAVDRLLRAVVRGRVKVSDSLGSGLLVHRDYAA